MSLEDMQGALQELALRPVVAEVAVRLRHVAQRQRHLWVVAAKLGLLDLHGSLKELQGLLRIVGPPMCDAEVRQGDRDFVVVRSVHPHLDVERALERGHLLLLLAERPVSVTQARQRHGQAPVVWTEPLFLDRQRALQQLLLLDAVAQARMGVGQVRQQLGHLGVIGAHLLLQLLQRLLQELDLTPRVAQVALDVAQQRLRPPQHPAVLLELVLREHALQPLLLLALDVGQFPVVRAGRHGHERRGGGPCRRPRRRPIGRIEAVDLRSLRRIAHDQQLQGLVVDQRPLEMLCRAFGPVHLDDEVVPLNLLAGDVHVPVSD
mmetsp:Transcript_60979/g.157244  ORF Transcript_60979/g.157244 Transcript_60979/m.157244 type:complete len:320 (+) Transcript_60979:166-1125(+)